MKLEKKGMLRAMTNLSTRLDPLHHEWLNDRGLKAIFASITAAGGEARAVGGAVRDTILGRPVGDIDLAVNLTPDLVTDALERAGLKAVPTGIDHGTITAVFDHKGYEITSLRRDIETDGRHAKVTFTKDWEEDAARRDFTFNALYADEGGCLYDYSGGQADLMAGRVRFIGDAKQRIREDVLRILRFFRFHAWYGRSSADAAGLEACRELSSLIPQLSVERVWREISRLLEAPNPVPVWELMLDNFILAPLLPEADNTRRLGKLVETEQSHSIQPSALRRLAALVPEGARSARHLAHHLKLSSRDAVSLSSCTTLPALLSGRLAPDLLPATLYEFGPKNVSSAALLIESGDFETRFDLRLVLKTCSEWQKPLFPLRGEDLMQLGLKQGPDVGIILRRTEAWWVEKCFEPDHATCLERAQQLIDGFQE